MNTMTNRERMLAMLQGRPHDRVPFCQYTSCAAPDQEIWELVGRNNFGIIHGAFAHRVDTPNCRFEQEDVIHDGKKGFRQTLITPEGELEEIRLVEDTYNSSSPATHRIKKPEDYKILMAYFRDMQVSSDISTIEAANKYLGDDGIPMICLPRTPYQQLWVEWVGIQDLCCHMLDHEELMEEVFAVMTEAQTKIFAAVCESVNKIEIPYIDFLDNITAPMIGQNYFRQYCLPGYNLLGEMLDETGQDIPIFVHMDGDLKPLWDCISETRVRGLDSFSPPPDNDTSAADALKQWPEMRLGLNFPSSVHLSQPAVIYEKASEILKEGAHSGRLWIQISENVPPGIWKTSFPQIVKAIDDYGTMS